MSAIDKVFGSAQWIGWFAVALQLGACHEPDQGDLVQVPRMDTMTAVDSAGRGDVSAFAQRTVDMLQGDSIGKGKTLVWEVVDSALNAPHPDTVAALLVLTTAEDAFRMAGDLDEALHVHERTNELLSTWTPQQPRPEHVTIWSNIATNLHNRKTIRVALLAAERAWSTSIALGDSTLKLNALQALASTQFQAGAFQQAIESSRRGLAMSRSRPGPPAQQFVWEDNFLSTLAFSLRELGLKEADDAFDAHIAFIVKHKGAESYDHGTAIINKGMSLLYERPLFPDSIIHYLQLGSSYIPNDHPYRQYILDEIVLPTVAWAHAHAGRMEEMFATMALDTNCREIDWHTEQDPYRTLQGIDYLAGTFQEAFMSTKQPRFGRIALCFNQEAGKGADHLLSAGGPDALLRQFRQATGQRKQHLLLMSELADEGVLPFDHIKAMDLMEQTKALRLRKFMDEAILSDPDKSGSYHALHAARRSLNSGAPYNGLTGAELMELIDSLSTLVAYEPMTEGSQQPGMAFQKARRIASNDVSIWVFTADENVVHVMAFLPDTFSYARMDLDSVQMETLRSAPAAFSASIGKQGVAADVANVLFGAIPLTFTAQTIVIPDGIFAQIPFDVLPVPQRSDTALLGDLTTIRYEYSIDLIERERKNAVPGTLFALAPEFSAPTLASDTDLVALNDLLAARPNLRANLGPLAHNREEVDALAERFKGNTITGRHLAKEQVLEGMRNAAVLHFATHAFADQDDPERSAIVISGDASQRSDATASSDRGWSSHTNDALLHAWEIQTMPLNAQLAVLSACETAVGREQAGEGVMSLARAFRYAGVDNIVSSLWKVDDAATKEIMLSFYDNLAKGMGKADALAEAKRAYRKAHPNAPPAYWAAFVLVGDNEPVVLERRRDPTWWIVVGGLLVALTIVWSSRKRVAQQKTAA